MDKPPVFIYECTSCGGRIYTTEALPLEVTGGHGKASRHLTGRDGIRCLGGLLCTVIAPAPKA